MKKYVIYQRVSTEEQKQKGYSLEAMHNKCEHYINAQENAKLITTYEDAGFSGSLPPSKRPGMKQLLEDMKNDKNLFDSVLVWKLDRLSRSLRDTLNLEFTFSKQSKALESVTERLDTSTASGRMFFNTIASFAEFESAQTRERTFNAMSSKIGQKHLGGLAPIGYKLVDGHYEIVPQEAIIVRKMFRLYIKLRSFNATANEMNRRCIFTLRGNKWTHARIKEVLINPIYNGRIAWHKTSRKNGRLPRAVWLFCANKTHKAIINETLYNEVQNVMGQYERGYK